jgi:hypothetical protein
MDMKYYIIAITTIIIIWNILRKLQKNKNRLSKKRWDNHIQLAQEGNVTSKCNGVTH